MRAHQRMLDIGRLGDFLRRALRGPVTRALRVVAVYRAFALDTLLRRCGQRVVNRVHIAEPRRAASTRNLNAVQQRGLGGNLEIRIVGVPILGADGGLVRRAVGHKRTHHDRNLRHAAATLVAQQLLTRLTKCARKIARFFRRHRRAGDHHQQMLRQRFVQQRRHGRVVGAGAIKALDAGAERCV